MCLTICKQSIHMRNGMEGRKQTKNMCLTICNQSIHAQWRYVLVFAVDETQYTCGP